MAYSPSLAPLGYTSTAPFGKRLSVKALESAIPLSSTQAAVALRFGSDLQWSPIAPRSHTDLA